MRALLVHPGVSTSVSDVHDGLWLGLKEMGGHELIPYRLDLRMERAVSWLSYEFRRLRRRGEATAEQKYTTDDIQYLAGQGVLEMALRRRVDWVLVISGMYVHPAWLILLRRAGVKVAVLLTESPYDDDRQVTIAAIANVVFTNDRASVSLLRLVNPDAYHLPHAQAPGFHGTAPPSEMLDGVPSHDVLLVGSGYQERMELCLELVRRGIPLALYGAWPLARKDSPLGPYILGGQLDNKRTALLYRRCKVALNPYRQSVGFGHHALRHFGGESLNARAYELAAAGVFTISSPRAELGEVFGDLVPTAETPDGWAATIRWWLDHDSERRSAAAHLPELVREHTYRARAERVVATLVEHDARGRDLSGAHARAAVTAVTPAAVGAL